jgi:L-iditol 2-dehydrogenase
MATTEAVVYHAPGDVRVEQVPRPVCGAGELLVAVDACAVCGTDFKAHQSGNLRILAPMVMGHEFTGRIAEVGTGLDGWAVGERVVMATSISCGACAYCRRGWRNLCVDLAPMGFSYPGGMARYTAIPARAVANGHVVKVPADLPATQAALAEPVSCAVNAMGNCGLAPGDLIVVIGAGPMGIINALVARAMGARRVILAEVNPARLRQAGPFGFDRLVNPTEEDLPALVKAETDGLGADVVLVAAPAAAPQEQAIALARKRGAVCLFASLPAGKSLLTVDSRPIHYGELRVVGSSDSTADHVARAVEFLALPRMHADRLVTHVLPLARVHEAFALMASGDCLRVVLTP